MVNDRRHDLIVLVLRHGNGNALMGNAIRRRAEKIEQAFFNPLLCKSECTNATTHHRALAFWRILAAEERDVFGSKFALFACIPSKVAAGGKGKPLGQVKVFQNDTSARTVLGRQSVGPERLVVCIRFVDALPLGGTPHFRINVIAQVAVYVFKLRKAGGGPRG